MSVEADPAGYTWTVRGSSADGGVTRLYVGRNSFSAGPAVSFRPDEPLPSAVDYLLGALTAEMVGNFASCLRERSVDFDAVECRIAGQLEDPLASIGVVGAKGGPAMRAITGTVYVSADADGCVLKDAWCTALSRSAVYCTLQRCVSLSIEMRVAP
jgi:hypothetical protein